MTKPNVDRDMPAKKDDCRMPSAHNRQPQLNPICACDCGTRGFIDGGGGDSEPEADPFFGGDEGAPMLYDPTPASSVPASFATTYADFQYGRYGFEYGTANIVDQDPFATRSPDRLSRVNSGDSMANHFSNSDPPSMNSSGFLPHRPDTPTTVLLKVGEWTVTTPGYYFTSNEQMYNGGCESEEVEEGESGG